MRYKPAELAKLIGQERQYVNTYVSRGKIIKDSDGFIDVSNPINKGWYDQMRAVHVEKCTDPSYTVPEYEPKNESKQRSVKKQAKRKKVEAKTPGNGVIKYMRSYRYLKQRKAEHVKDKDKASS